jgi:hypothetical protein
MTGPTRKPIGKLLGYGGLSCLLYGLLFRYEEQILAWTAKGRWYFALPVAVAFVFSLVHGAFTGCFWEALGLRARDARER